MHMEDIFKDSKNECFCKHFLQQLLKQLICAKPEGVMQKGFSHSH